MFVEKGWFVPTLQFGPEDIFIFADWEETPVGPYRALFHFTSEDFRTLYTNGEESKKLVSGIHRFDEMHVVDILSRRENGEWTVEMDTGDKGILHMEIAFRTTPMLKVVNWFSSHMPDKLVRNPLYCRMIPRLGSLLLGTDPHFKISGSTELGRKILFRLDRIYEVTGGSCTWDGKDQGPLSDCRFQHDMGDLRPVSKPMAIYLSMFVD